MPTGPPPQTQLDWIADTLDHVKHALEALMSQSENVAEEVVALKSNLTMVADHLGVQLAAQAADEVVLEAAVTDLKAVNVQLTALIATLTAVVVPAPPVA